MNLACKISSELIIKIWNKIKQNIGDINEELPPQLLAAKSVRWRLLLLLLLKFCNFHSLESKNFYLIVTEWFSRA